MGADGIHSILARRTRGAWLREDRTQTFGYFLPGSFTDRLMIQFLRRGNGYIWAFPRPDHVSLGICCDLGTWSSEELRRELVRFAAEHYPGAPLKDAPRFSALVPTPREATMARVPAEGRTWALAGDALGTVDPITREAQAETLDGRFPSCRRLPAPKIVETRRALYPICHFLKRGDRSNPALPQTALPRATTSPPLSKLTDGVSIYCHRPCSRMSSPTATAARTYMAG